MKLVSYKFTWLTVTLTVLAGAAGWYAGSATSTVSTRMEPPSAPLAAMPTIAKEVEQPPAALPRLLNGAATAESEMDPLLQQRLCQQTARLLATATAAEAAQLLATTHLPYLRECAIRRWAELDPTAALAWVEALSRDDPSFAAMGRALFSGWAHVDPRAAFVAVEARRLERSWRGMEGAAAHRALADDPVGALHLLKDFRGITGDASPPRWVWEKQAERFARACFSQVELGAGSPIFAKSATEAARAWSRGNPRGFREWVRIVLSKPGNEFQSQTGLFALLLESDAASATSMFASTPPSSLRNAMKVAYAGHLAAIDPSAAAEWITNELPAGKSRAWASWVATVMKSGNPAKAAEIAASLPDPESRRSALNNLLYEWGTMDFEAALAWAKNQPATPEEPPVLSVLAYRWLDLHGPVAARYIMEHADGSWSRMILPAAARSLPFGESVRLAAARDFSDEDAEVLFEALGSVMARGQHSAAALSGLKLERQEAIVRVAAEEMKTSHAKQAVEWAARLPAGSLRNAAQEVLIGTAPSN